MVNANPQVSSYAAPKTSVECLPEGKRILTCVVDFTQLPIIIGDINYPEFMNNSTVIESQSIATKYNGYQLAEVNLTNCCNAANGLTEVRAVIWRWSPAYIDVANIGQSLNAVRPLYLTNQQTLQSVTMDSNDTRTVVNGTHSTGLVAVTSGVAPFFGGYGTIARFLLPTATTTTAPFGKVTCQFLNFDPPSYSPTSYSLLDNFTTA